MSKKLWPPQIIDIELLDNHPRNSNVQSNHTHEELVENMDEHGMDETLLVVPKFGKEEVGYWIIAGNHRKKAAKKLGHTELWCVVRDDWTEAEAEIQVVKRNYVRGDISRKKFTSHVNWIAKEYGLAVDVIMDRMGFEDEEAFAKMYKSEEAFQEKLTKQMLAETKEVRFVENLSEIVSHIFETYGATVPQSFIIFPLGGQKHLYIESTAAIRRALEEISTRCVEEGIDLNIALGGILNIGMQVTNFKSKKGSVLKNQILQKGKAVGIPNIQIDFKQPEDDEDGTDK